MINEIYNFWRELVEMNLKSFRHLLCKREDEVIKRAKDTVYLECTNCRWRSEGWVIENKIGKLAR